MARIRVLIVDDSVVVRRMVSEALSADPSIEVVGTAPNGRIALAKIEQLSPDLVTMDLEMPELDGLETLPLLRAKHPALPVIIFSTLTQHGAVATVEALSRGASDWVSKPVNASSFQAAQDHVRLELVPKIKTLTAQKASVRPLIARALTPINRTSALASLAPVARPSLSGSLPPAARRTRPLASPQRIDVVCIGVSTGGPNALAKVIPALPKALGVPVLIVQHMPPVFTTMLARRLSTPSGIQIHEGQHGMDVVPGAGWLAPGDWHMLVERKNGRMVLATNQAPPESSCRPAVDVLFRSVAKVYGARTLAVILTGMGQDGLRGAEQIVDAGGSIIAQDEATSVVWGMPGAVVRAGLAEEILPLERIAPEIARRVQVGREAPLVARSLNG